MQYIDKLKEILKELLFAIGLATLIQPIVQLSIYLFPNIDWHFVTLAYSLILLFQIIYYRIFSEFKWKWAIVSFLINFILWSAEIIIISQQFPDSIFYKGEFHKLYIIQMGATLFVINRIILDKTLNKFQIKSKLT